MLCYKQAFRIFQEEIAKTIAKTSMLLRTTVRLDTLLLHSYIKFQHKDFDHYIEKYIKKNIVTEKVRWKSE